MSIERDESTDECSDSDIAWEDNSSDDNSEDYEPCLDGTTSSEDSDEHDVRQQSAIVSYFWSLPSGSQMKESVAYMVSTDRDTTCITFIDMVFERRAPSERLVLELALISLACGVRRDNIDVYSHIIEKYEDVASLTCEMIVDYAIENKDDVLMGWCRENVYLTESMVEFVRNILRRNESMDNEIKADARTECTSDAPTEHNRTGCTSDAPTEHTPVTSEPVTSEPGVRASGCTSKVSALREFIVGDDPEWCSL